MLRMMFDEPMRIDSGELLEVFREIDGFIESLEMHTPENDVERKKNHRLLLWARGFKTSLNELEQSMYCCNKFQQSLEGFVEEDLCDRERDDYYRHTYFFKNAIVRVFSILDKLGYFLNENFRLRTERKKARFSYFTVLRQMRQSKHYAGLEKKLTEIKERHQGPMNRLRAMRNAEVHWINTELRMDLNEIDESACFLQKHVENIQKDQEDLDQGYAMVCSSLTTAFRYISNNT